MLKILLYDNLQFLIPPVLNMPAAGRRIVTPLRPCGVAGVGARNPGPPW
jgi:hypothetical protein